MRVFWREGEILGALLAKRFNEHGEVNMLENVKPMYKSIEDLLRVRCADRHLFISDKIEGK
jgi:hypothetical protein